MAEVIGWNKDIMAKCTCKACGAIVRYNRETEVKKQSGTDIDGGSWCDHYVKCPNCESKITIRSY
jgi:hypothetical protein